MTKNGNRLLSDVLKQVQKAGKRVLNLDGRRPKSMMRIKHLNKLIRMYLSLSPQTGECHAFGRYQRVKLSSADYEKLVSEFGSDKVDAAIEQVDMRAESTDNNKGWTRWEAVVRQYITNGWLPTDKKDTESKSVMDDIDFAN